MTVAIQCHSGISQGHMTNLLDIEFNVMTFQTLDASGLHTSLSP